MKKISTFIKENLKILENADALDFTKTKDEILRKLQCEFECAMTLYDKNHVEVDSLDLAKTIYFGFGQDGDYIDKLSHTSMALQKDRSFERLKEMIDSNNAVLKLIERFDLNLD